MKKSLVFGILLSICMTIPTMADNFNSGIVIEPNIVIAGTIRRNDRRTESNCN